MISNVNGVSGVQEVKSVSKASKNAETKSAAADTKVQNEDELVDIKDLVEDGTLKEEKVLWFFKTGNYVYTADGEKTYADIKEEFDLQDGALRNSNQKLFSDISGNADGKVPKAGTKIVIKGQDVKPQAMNVKDDNDEALDGFYKSSDGTVYYEIQSGDTQEGIYKKFANKSISRNYKTADVLRGYSEYTLQPGVKVPLAEKSFLGKLISKIFG